MERLFSVRMILAVAFLGSQLYAQSRVEYIGGTASKLESGSAVSIQVTDENYFAFYAKKVQVRVAYDHINELAYGQKVDRRLLMAVADGGGHFAGVPVEQEAGAFPYSRVHRRRGPSPGDGFSCG